MLQNRKVNKNSTLYKDVFYEVFKSMQLSGAYTLYYEIDLSKEELQEFHLNMTKHNEEELEHKIFVEEIQRKILAELDFDCSSEASLFPYRAKLKMYGKKTTPKTIATISCAATDAIELYLILSIYTMIIDYHYDSYKINIWFFKLKEFAKLYGDGLTDDHVFKYFMQECELEIYE